MCGCGVIGHTFVEQTQPADMKPGFIIEVQPMRVGLQPSSGLPKEGYVTRFPENAQVGAPLKKYIPKAVYERQIEELNATLATSPSFDCVKCMFFCAAPCTCCVSLCLVRSIWEVPWETAVVDKLTEINGRLKEYDMRLGLTPEAELRKNVRNSASCSSSCATQNVRAR